MYEITCLGAETAGADLEKIITNNQGKIGQKQNLGQRRLAYKIKQQESAHYCCLNFTIAKEQLEKLSDQLRLAKSIWRYLLVNGSYILEERPLKKPATKSLDQPLGKSLDKSLDKSLGKSLDKSLDKSLGAIPAEKPTPRPRKKTRSLDDKLAEILKE